MLVITDYYRNSQTTIVMHRHHLEALQTEIVRFLKDEPALVEVKP